MAQNAWTREELLKVLSLYCQIPFGQMDARNPVVIALAEVIGRTPSAVAFKLVNFASMDPVLRARGVKGMENASNADREIWAEFYGRWDILAENSVDIEPPPTSEEEEERLSGTVITPAGPTEVMREVLQRRGQGFFRAAVLAAHDGMCCVTEIRCEPLLRASHIVPWSQDESLRLDPRNGLCLNALHDAAFDRGLITFGERFEMQISKRLKDEVPASVYEEMFANRAGRPIRVPERFAPAAESMAFHRREVFQN